MIWQYLCILQFFRCVFLSFLLFTKYTWIKHRKYKLLNVRENWQHKISTEAKHKIIEITKRVFLFYQIYKKLIIDKFPPFSLTHVHKYLIMSNYDHTFITFYHISLIASLKCWNHPFTLKLMKCKCLMLKLRRKYCWWQTRLHFLKRNSKQGKYP